MSAALVACVSVVVAGAGVGTAVQVNRGMVGQEPEGLEAERHQRVVDWVEGEGLLHGTSTHSDQVSK